MQKLILILFCLITVNVAGQKLVSGTITDRKTRKPIEYVTIYINGTTIGTISNTRGQFELKNFTPPCKIIFSHVGYKTKEISIKKYTGKLLTVALEQKSVDLNTITVPEKNKRQENLLLFRSEFLGNDYWGTNARITNENALRFKWIYEKKQLQVFNKIIKQKLLEDNSMQWSDDSLWVEFNSQVELTVSASEPLQVELPLLGYSLHVDVIDFYYTFNKTLEAFTCGYQGYYYFKPCEQQKITPKIIQNRIKTWYHSREHFCQSLYRQKLKENGYRVVKEIENSKGKKQYQRIQLDSLITFQNELGLLPGLYNQEFHILYFQNNKGLPIDLTNKKGRNPLQSMVRFLNDSCYIKSDGITPDNALMFSPEIGTKKVGAALPAGFVPESRE